MPIYQHKNTFTNSQDNTSLLATSNPEQAPSNAIAEVQDKDFKIAMNVFKVPKEDMKKPMKTQTVEWKEENS